MSLKMSDDGISDFLSDSDSSEDELLDLLPNERVKNEEYLENTVPQYSDETFFEHFRLTKERVSYIAEVFGNSQYFHYQSGQFGNIPASDQILIYLWYVGHQTASFRDVGDRFNITISSVNRIVRRLTLFLSNMSVDIIKWPDDDEKRISEEHFRRNGFPNIIGAIDGSHIKIDKPINDPDSYINRKGYYSIQIQAVCDHKRKIIDIFIGYPGSVHDSRVYRNSPLKNTLEEKCGRYFLLGDSGYPLQANLLTPFKDRGNLTRRQQNYNLKLARSRYVIEHTFGILKQKFRQLYHLKLRNIRYICHFIRATCVLHNMALDDDLIFNIYDEEIPVFAREPDEHGDQAVDDVGAAAIRDRVANTLPL